MVSFYDTDTATPTQTQYIDTLKILKYIGYCPTHVFDTNTV